MTAAAMLLSPDLFERVVDHLGHPRRTPSSRGSLSVHDAASALGLEREVLIKAIADVERLPFVRLGETLPAPDAVKAVPESLARKHGCLPLFLNDAELTIAVAQPERSRLDELALALDNHEVIFVLVDESELAPMLDIYYPSAAESVVAAYLAKDKGLSASGLIELGGKPPVAKIVDAILERAARCGASDIHIEPFEGSSRVRMRVDGMLQPAFAFDGTLHEAIISRVKILAEMNILDRFQPQDGRFRYQAGTRAVDARVSTLRLLHGEKCVIRLLPGEAARPVSMDELGLPASMRPALERMIDQPYGLLLITGPTGSGKTTTLYAALQRRNEPDSHLISLEDPVEAQLPGVCQVPMRSEHGLTFATALRAVLRQDPNVVMVGEIRDQETAEIATRAALTGHLLLSTLHTNDAPEAVTRMLEMGVQASNLAASLLGVVAQRLVRRLCPCHQYEMVSLGKLEALGLGHLGRDVPFPVPRGCTGCHHTGYRGRFVIFELMAVDDAIRRLILQNAPSDQIREAARAAGMRPLLVAGLREALAGRTSLEEIFRVVNHTP